MAKRRIRIYGENVLREKAGKIENIDNEIKQLAEDMLETMAEANGVGLAGNQVGVLKRIIALDIPPESEEERHFKEVLINPEFTYKSDEKCFGEEGCLSLPGVYSEVERSAEVEVKYLDLDGNERKVRADGLFAVALQHEIDHLDGLVFVERVDDVTKRTLKPELKKIRKEAKQYK